MRDAVAGLLLLGVGIALTYHFACCWYYGYFFIHEHNEVVLTLETLMSVGIAAFGLERLWYIVRKRDKKG